MVLREAIPVRVMKPTSVATERVLWVRKIAATLPMRASGIGAFRACGSYDPA